MESQTEIILRQAINRHRAQMHVVADLVRAGVVKAPLPPSDAPTARQPVCGKPVPCGRNDACPCRSGRKWKRCCGTRAVRPARPVAATAYLANS